MRKSTVLPILCCVMIWPSLVLANGFPKEDDVKFAKDVANTLQARVLAALIDQFANTEPGNVDVGNEALSLLFNDQQNNYRLVGTLKPIGGKNSLPKDRFERRALNAAIDGQSVGPKVIRVGYRKYVVRQTVALANNDKSCSMCHVNYGPVDPNQYVGMLAINVPVY